MAISRTDLILVTYASASSTTAVTTSTDTTGASAAVVIFSHEGDNTTYSLACSKGGTTVEVEARHDAGNNLSLIVFFVYGFTGGAAHTFTVTMGAARSERRIGAECYSGSFTSGFSAATDQQAGGSGGGTVDAGSLVTDRAAYLVHIIADRGNGQIDTPGTGWTTGDSATAGLCWQVRNEASAGTFDPTATLTFMFEWATIAIAFGEGGGGGGGGASGRDLMLMGVGT